MPRSTGVLHYLDAGSGTCVILLHGMSLNSAMWRPQLAELASRHRVLAPDLRGFGRSPGPSSPEAYSMAAHATDVRLLLDECGVNSVAIVGFSFGGYVALQFLHDNAERVRALALISTRADADDATARKARSAEQDRLQRPGEPIATASRLRAMLSPVTRATKPTVVAEFETCLDGSVVGAVGAHEAAKHRQDFVPHLTSVRVPTLIIAGADDEVVPPEASSLMHEKIQNSRLVVVPGAGHMVTLEAATSVNAPLFELLESA